jgi:hypothetical protein
MGMSCSETENVKKAGNEHTTEWRNKSYRISGGENESQTGGWIDGAAAQASPLDDHERRISWLRVARTDLYT